jgi:hypothetical protein
LPVQIEVELLTGRLQIAICPIIFVALMILHLALLGADTFLILVLETGSQVCNWKRQAFVLVLVTWY